MDAFTNSTTQATLAKLMDQLKLLTNQLYNFEFEANDVQVYPTLCKYCDEPHMSTNGGSVRTNSITPSSTSLIILFL